MKQKKVLKASNKELNESLSPYFDKNWLHLHGFTWFYTVRVIPVQPAVESIWDYMYGSIWNESNIIVAKSKFQFQLYAYLRF